MLLSNSASLILVVVIRLVYVGALIVKQERLQVV